MLREKARFHELDMEVSQTVLYHSMMTEEVRYSEEDSKYVAYLTKLLK